MLNFEFHSMLCSEPKGHHNRAGWTSLHRAGHQDSLPEDPAHLRRPLCLRHERKCGAADGWRPSESIPKILNLFYLNDPTRETLELRPSCFNEFLLRILVKSLTTAAFLSFFLELCFFSVCAELPGEQSPCHPVSGVPAGPGHGGVLQGGLLLRRGRQVQQTRGLLRHLCRVYIQVRGESANCKVRLANSLRCWTFQGRF